MQFDALLRAQQTGQVLGNVPRDYLAGHEHRDSGRIGHDLIGAHLPKQRAVEIVQNAADAPVLALFPARIAVDRFGKKRINDLVLVRAQQRYNRPLFFSPDALSCRSRGDGTSTERHCMPVDTVEFVIKGLTEQGKPFRPSDWAERLCGVMSAFGSDGRMQYSPYVFPIDSAGLKCVVVDTRLEDIEPMAYRFLVNFARDNTLQIRPGRGVKRENAAGTASQA